MEVIAVAKYIDVSPIKARLVADAVRGKKVEEALSLLRLGRSPVARKVAKVVKSASANAENNFQLSLADLRVKRIFVDGGPMQERARPQARGRVAPILRRTSHITVVVEED